jgi:uncharacterized protein (DUF1800 family)
MPALDPITGNLGENRAKHLLRRLTFGYSKADVNTFQGININTALNQLLSFTMPTPPRSFTGADWTNPANKPQANEEDFKQEEAFRIWWLGKMYEDNTAFEKLTFFLHTIITTKRGVVGNSRFLYYQNQLFRRYLFNDFTNTNPNFNRYHQLILKASLDNSMLIFLDGRTNEKGLPNENFARELLELFTLGKGETRGAGDYTNYTENDIREAAKALTGWKTDDFFNPASNINTATIDPDTGLPTGVVRVNQFGEAFLHDNTIKQVLGVNIIPNPALLTPTGQPTAASALDEVVQLINAIFNKRDTDNISLAAKYFVRRLYRFFVHHEITPAVETNIIVPLAFQMQSEGFRISGVMRRLFASEHFFEFGTSSNNGQFDDKFGAMIKSPLEVTLGLMRYFRSMLASQIPTHDSNYAGFYEKMSMMTGVLMEMGLDFLEPYDVAGYEPYHQAPNYQRNWITTNNLANRYKFVRDLFEGNLGFGVDVYAWAKNTALSGITNTIATTPTVVGGISVAKDLARHVAREFLPLYQENSEITEKRMNYFAFYHIRDIAGVNPNDPDARFNAWVFGWNSANPAIIESNARGPLKALLGAILQSPEYQLF